MEELSAPEDSIGTKSVAGQGRVSRCVLILRFKIFSRVPVKEEQIIQALNSATRTIKMDKMGYTHNHKVYSCT
jgi:hypothetical protein